MRTRHDIKAAARVLRRLLEKEGVELKHGVCLDIASEMLTAKSWNVLSASFAREFVSNSKVEAKSGAGPIESSLSPFEINGRFAAGSAPFIDRETCMAAPNGTVVLLGEREVQALVEHYASMSIDLKLTRMEPSIVQRIEVADGLFALAADRNGELEEVMAYDMLIQFSDDFRPCERNADGSRVNALPFRTNLR